ncbi:MAG: hypothetical protein IH595_08085 [Bacteroidales bacterium]|nr:hypothetical protein [Bacteroidales bacterium]
MQKASLALLLFVLFAVPFRAHAGWVISRETTDDYGNKTFQTVFIEDTLMRFETPSSVSIFDLAQQRITLIFGQHQAYWQGTASQLRQQIFEIADEQMQELIQHAPPDKQDTLRKMYAIERKKREKALNDTVPSTIPNISIIETNKTANILGYPVKMYQVNVDSVLVEELWVTQAVDPYEHLNINVMIKLMQAIDPVTGKAYKTRSAEYDKLLYHGLVMKKIRFLPDGEKLVSIVKSVRKVNINETIFEIPANYVSTKIQAMMLMDINQKILSPQGSSLDQGDQDFPSLPPPLKIPEKRKDLDLNMDTNINH